MELKLFVEFRNQDVLGKVDEFIDKQWKHNIKLIRDFEVAYVDEYEDAQYGTVYAVADDELNLIGVFAKHEPFTYREVAELVREDSGESGDIVLFDITGYTGLDYNMPEYFKGYEGETDAFLEDSQDESHAVGHDENLPESIFSWYFKTLLKDTQKKVEKANKEVEEMVNKEEHGPVLAEYEEDIVNKPSHYTNGNIEVIDMVEQITATYPPELAFAIGNVIKYTARSQMKNGKQDLLKAQFYLNRAIEKYDEE